MLTLYDHSESVCCQKVRIALAEKGVEYHRRLVNCEEREHLGPEYLRINPKGVVPALVDEEGRTIDESSIMLEYLEDRYPDPQLMPSDPYWRAKRRLWARQIDDGMHIPHISTISFVISFGRKFRQRFNTQEKVDAWLKSLPGEALRDAQRKAAAADLKSETFRTSLMAYDRFLGDMEAQLEHTPWLAGEAFSLADIDVIPYIWRLNNLQLSGMWKHRPHVADWFSRVTARPAFTKAVLELQEEHWLEAMRGTGHEAWPIVSEMLR